MMICNTCGSADLHPLYALGRTPVFLNKLYGDRASALACPTAKIDLRSCSLCGLVFNTAFESALMDYDDLYIQSQGHSSSFRDYSNSVIGRFTDNIDRKRDKIVEIGCGKEAYFLNMLADRGYDIVGFDPVYDGDSPRVTKAFFGPDTATGIDANVAIMRFILSLLERPHAFLSSLKAILPAGTRIYIETPRFEWSLEHDAFWDISHESCSYFTEAYFSRIFSGRATIFRTFSDQYMIVSANLDDLRTDFAPLDELPQPDLDGVGDLIANCRSAIRGHEKNYVWGAGAKGIAFANLLDPEAKLIAGVIDTNPEKQGRFLALSGQACVSPESVAWGELGTRACLWIMNGNYKTEILERIPHYQGKVVVMGEADD